LCSCAPDQIFDPQISEEKKKNCFLNDFFKEEKMRMELVEQEAKDKSRNLLNMHF
jgi:hypothetical protein